MQQLSKLVLLILLMSGIQAMAQKQYSSDWSELRERPYPQWFSDAKLGIFIHWSVSSVPSYSGKEAYSEWFLRGLQLGDTTRLNFQNRVYGKDFQYEDYAPLLKGELFDANEWAQLFKRAGARYVVLVSKHHDGYCLWPSKYQPKWNSTIVGPKRDIVGELTSAVRNQDMKMGLYYSLPEWNHPLHRWYTDPDTNVGRYVEEYMIPQFKELVSTYKPSLIFSDGEWRNHSNDWHAAELISWYYNIVGDEAIVNNRWGHGSNIGFLTPEYSAGLIKTDRPWAEVRGLGRSFGLNRNEKLEAYMTPRELIHFFVNAVANGGGIILNVGPKADGQIPLLQQERLVQLGKWLEVNGEAIYNSKAWKVTHEERPISFQQTDKQIDFNWVRNAPIKGMKEDHFSIQWNAYLQAPESGKYTFSCKADDALKVYVDNQLVVAQGQSTAKQADGEVMGFDKGEVAQGTIKLKAGERYPLRIEYAEDKQNASVQLFWQNTKSKTALAEKQIIPAEVYYQSAEGIEHGLNGTYHSTENYLCYTQKEGDIYAIALQWPGRKLLIPQKIDGIQKVELLGYQGDLPFTLTENGIEVDVSAIYHNNMPCEYAWVFKLSKGAED